MRLSGRQYELLTRALLDAFPSPGRLERMVRYRLDRNLAAIALGDDLEEIVFKLVRSAESDGWLPDLVSAARESNPRSGSLVSVAHILGLSSLHPQQPELEALIRSSNDFLDIDVWRQQLGEIEGRVCRIEIPSKGGHIFGTGFLVGPEAVMTNYHVVEPLLDSMKVGAIRTPLSTDAASVVLRFDFKRTHQGLVINPGTEFRLTSSDWLIDHSPYRTSDSDHQVDRLDYALLRIEGSPGQLPLGGASEPDAPRRGWIEIPDHPYDFKPGTPLLIVQHPSASPLQLAIDTDAVISVSHDRAIVKYRTNTLRGSSGSPYFSANWKLVALHHSGDPDFKQPHYNAGTLIDVIAAQIRSRGHASVLGPG